MIYKTCYILYGYHCRKHLTITVAGALIGVRGGYAARVTTIGVVQRTLHSIVNFPDPIMFYLN
jgi:hypothetical protein